MSKADITFTTLTPVRGMAEIAPILSLIKGHGYIAGGYARYTVSPNGEADFSDIDIFARSTEDFEYLKQQLLSQGSLVTDNDLALTFAVGLYPHIQLIKPFREGATGTLEDILLHFDFTVTMVGITDEGTVISHSDFEADEKEKVLHLLGIHCPISSVKRFCKYYKKGYKFNLQEIAKLFVDYDNRSQEFKDKISKIANINPTVKKTKEEAEDIRAIYLAMFID